MRLAIMQPYLFPYIGYFQLISAADKFVCYDDVSYIKQGWINSNNIFVNGREYLFTVPLKKASSFKVIRNTEINLELYPAWRSKFLQTLAQAYNKAPFYKNVMMVIKTVVENNFYFISGLAGLSILAVCAYLKIKSELLLSSSCYNNSHLKSYERIIDICKKEHADVYINSTGGQTLYSKTDFTNSNLQLQFLQPAKISYKVNGVNRNAHLSIIDVLMYNSPECVSGMLNKYELI